MSIGGLHRSYVQVRVQFDEQRFCDLIGDEVHLSLRLDCLIIRIDDHFDIVIRGAERKPVRGLRRSGGRRQKGQHQSGRELVRSEQAGSSPEAAI